MGAYYNGIKAPSVTVKSTVTSVDVKGCGDSAKAVDGTLINEIGGVGYNQWNQPTKIEANTAGAVLTYKQVVFPIAECQPSRRSAVSGFAAFAMAPR